MKDLIHDDQHAVQKLNNTFVRYDGVPYLVRCGDRVYTHKEVTLCNIKNGLLNVVKHAPYHDDKIMTEIGPLGYVNFVEHAVFCHRRPVRGMLAGLSERSVMWSQKRDPMAVVSVTSEAFFDMLNNKYPSFEEAVELIKTRKSVAFHKFACLAKQGGRFKEIRVMYRDSPIGTVKSGRIELYPSDSLFISETILMTLGLTR